MLQDACLRASVPFYSGGERREVASFAAARVKEAFNAAQILQLLTKLKKEALALCPPGAEPFPALFHDPGMRAIPSGLFFFFFFPLCHFLRGEQCESFFPWQGSHPARASARTEMGQAGSGGKRVPEA